MGIANVFVAKNVFHKINIWDPDQFQENMLISENE